MSTIVSAVLLIRWFWHHRVICFIHRLSRMWRGTTEIRTAVRWRAWRWQLKLFDNDYLFPCQISEVYWWLNSNIHFLDEGNCNFFRQFILSTTSWLDLQYFGCFSKVFFKAEISKGRNMKYNSTQQLCTIIRHFIHVFTRLRIFISLFRFLCICFGCKQKK